MTTRPIAWPVPVTGSARSDFTVGPFPISNPKELSRYYIRALWGVKGKILAMRCLRLTHVNLRVEKLDDAVRFYKQVMGLEQIQRDDTRGRGAWFQLGAQQLHLAEDATPQPRSKRHFAVEVRDLAEARRSAAEHGAEIDQEEAGRFWMRDPSGNRIEVVQAP